MIPRDLRRDQMRRFVEGVDRGQTTLFPECLEDWIDEGNPVRAIDTFVEKLDLSGLGFDGVAPEATGRPSYHPSGLLKLYIYGYLNRIQSSRRLEREAGRKSGSDLAAATAGARRQDDCRFSQGQWTGDQEGVRSVRRSVPRDGSADEGERCHRRLEVQSRQHARQELHEGQSRAAAGATGGERRALSRPARHGRSAGPVGSARSEDRASQGEARQAHKRDATPRSL